ncbi:hypothetical protein ID866_6665 [Astraeus odoratus]|nr:hypothetical protein ID866_6665 [Astraeus odoratus]
MAHKGRYALRKGDRLPLLRPLGYPRH